MNAIIKYFEEKKTSLQVHLRSQNPSHSSFAHRSYNFSVHSSPAQVVKGEESFRAITIISSAHHISKHVAILQYAHVVHANTETQPVRKESLVLAF